MQHSGLSLKLKLAYPPLSNFDFTVVKKEKVVQDMLKNSMLYAICQRPVLSFENATFDPDRGGMLFEIHQQGNGNFISCFLPLYQECLEHDETKPVIVKFGSHDKNWNESEPPINNFHGFQFYNQDDEFLLWLSPEKFIYSYYTGTINATVQGDYRHLTRYYVHYVGKATDQGVWERLTGHSTLQEILSLERPMTEGHLPTHEVSLLLFGVAGALGLKIYEWTTEGVDAFTKSLSEGKFPSNKTISLDAEKALVKLLDPSYNSVKFVSYPVSKDGLSEYEYNKVLYHIEEDITLQYDNGEIVCALDEAGSDFIAISDNKTAEVIKRQDA